MKRGENPLNTFALFVYNQENFIREAVSAAFAQTYSPLEIILSDDCSNDQTFTIMRDMAGAYRGPHTIILNRNNHRLGIGGHVNRIMEIAEGMLIIAAAGDDISAPERVERMYHVYESTKGNAKSIFSNNFITNACGEIQRLDFIEPLVEDQYSPENMAEGSFEIAGCSHAWSREIFDIFGPMITPLTCEDRVIPFRSALLGGIKYIHDPLVRHRRHENNTWHYGHCKEIGKIIKHDIFVTFEWKYIFENWLRDLEKMRNLFPEREAEMRHLKNIVSRRLSIIEDDIGLITDKWPDKMRILVKKVLEGEDIKIIRHKIGRSCMPKIYRKYMIWKTEKTFRKSTNEKLRTRERGSTSCISLFRPQE